MPPSDRLVALALAAAAILLYVASGLGHPTTSDYYASLAEALRQGRWWLDTAPAHLSQVLSCADGRFCVPHLPMPALLVLPFLVVFEPGVAQSLAAAVAGGLCAAPAYLVLRRIGAPMRVALLVTTFGIAGTALWFSSADGGAEFLAHAVAVLFGSLALLAALDRRPAWLVGALIGAALLSRAPVGLAAPGLAILSSMYRSKPLASTIALAALGLAPFVGIAILYDLARWGVAWDEGYLRIAAADPSFDQGLFSLAYLPRHFYAIVVQAPDYVDQALLFLRPSWIGVSLLLTSPALVYALAALRYLAPYPEARALALAAMLPLVPNLLQGSIGAPQFGYRFSLDAQAFLLPLVALGAGWRGGSWGAPRLGFVLAVAWSILANLYGVIAIIQLAYVR